MNSGQENGVLIFLFSFVLSGKNNVTLLINFWNYVFNGQYRSNSHKNCNYNEIQTHKTLERTLLFIITNSNSVQNTLLSVAIVTIKRKFFFTHTSSATLTISLIKLNTLKTEAGITHRERSIFNFVLSDYSFP